MIPHITSIPNYYLWLEPIVKKVIYKYIAGMFDAWFANRPVKYIGKWQTSSCGSLADKISVCQPDLIITISIQKLSGTIQYIVLFG